MKKTACEITVRNILTEERNYRVISFRVGVLVITFSLDNQQMATLMEGLWHTARGISFYLPAGVFMPLLKPKGQYADVSILEVDELECGD